MTESAVARSDVWEEVKNGLSQDPVVACNTAVEACERWAGDRGRLALTVCHPDGSAERWTYFALARAASKMSRVFASAGLKRGDRVAAVVSRQVEAWICALGAWRSGLVYVPLYSGLGTAALAYRLRVSGARMVVADHRWRQSVAGALRQLTADVEVLTVAGPKGIGMLKGDRSFWAEMERAAPDGPLAQTGPSDPATYMFSSGTSGEPKACVVPHSGFISVIPFAQAQFALGQSDNFFATSDPGWAYGLYTTGCVVMSLGFPRTIYSGDFDPVAWLRLMEAEQVTVVASAPSAYRRLVKAAERQPPPQSLRAGVSAGEPLDGETVEAWAQVTGTHLLDGYGLTEVAMVLANLANEDRPVVAGALNSVVPGFTVELVTPEGQPVPEGDQGLIAISGAPFLLSSGYANVPEKWEARFRDGRFVTEDLARRDEEGRWWFVGRADDVIVTSGYNVGPAEVEAVIMKHPAVAEVAVVAAPDPARGSAVRAVIVTHSDAPSHGVITSEIQAIVRSQIGRHAYPRIVDYVNELPKTETGKIRRSELRQSGSSTSPAAPT